MLRDHFFGKLFDFKIWQPVVKEQGFKGLLVNLHHRIGSARCHENLPSHGG
jgi:hypothetical protein